MPVVIDIVTVEFSLGVVDKNGGSGVIEVLRGMLVDDPVTFAVYCVLVSGVTAEIGPVTDGP